MTAENLQRQLEGGLQNLLRHFLKGAW